MICNSPQGPPTSPWTGRRRRPTFRGRTVTRDPRPRPRSGCTRRRPADPASCQPGRARARWSGTPLARAPLRSPPRPARRCDLPHGCHTDDELALLGHRWLRDDDSHCGNSSVGYVVIGPGLEGSSRGMPETGLDPQPRVRQASSQAITVNDRVDVADRPARTNPGKGTLTGPCNSRVTHHAADNANPAVTSHQTSRNDSHRRISASHRQRGQSGRDWAPELVPDHPVGVSRRRWVSCEC